MSIDSWPTYRRYLKEDLEAYGLGHWRPWHALKFPQLAFQRKLRTYEYASSRLRGPVGRLLAFALRYRCRQAGIKLGFSIPPGTFGPGLCIVHWGSVVVNENARIGARCRIHPCTLIGGKKDGAPTIGDDVYIGNGAKIIGGIRIGDRVKIGANAVVTKSFADNQILVGIPAKPIARAGAPKWPE